MKFRTEVQIPDSEKKIEIDDKIFSIGSCFSTEISELLANGQLQTLNNPFGTIFNPHSINVALQRIHDSDFYTDEDLVAYQNQMISLEHHSIFDSPFAHKTLEKINTEIEAANLFLQRAEWVVITYGTSFVYEFLPKNKLVANCHKIPAKFFYKKLLSQNEIEESIAHTIETLNDICPENVVILFTVSPVRHTKDGMVENNRSKAKLISALHETITGFSNCHYLPIYEIMMDDLRDYRFFKEDMIHPTQQAIQYIFEKFGNAYFSDATMDFVEENFKILQSLNHKPSDETDLRYMDFLQNLQKKIEVQQMKVKHKIF